MLIVGLVGRDGLRTLHAQVITGRVIDDQTGAAVGRGFVIVLNDRGLVVERTLTASDGTFEIPLHGPGVYRVRSERIAYRPFQSGPLQLAAGEVHELVLRIAPIPVQLEAIEVEERSQCRVDPEGGARTAVLWSEIRKALDGTTWTGTQRGYRFRFLEYERELDSRARRVLREDVADRAGRFSTPFRTRDAPWLAEHGFVVDEVGSMWFYAPDTEVLQHEAFLATHCFRVVRDDDRPNLVGLEFRPTDGTDHPDVSGVLWLDETTAELRTMEFQYVQLPREVQDDRVGGTVSFLQLPNGAWIIRDWVIRLPLVGVDANLSDPVLRRARVAVRGYLDTGGEVVAVSLSPRDTVYTAPMAKLTGSVRDASSGRYLRGAEVRIVGTSYGSITDATGAFTINAYVNGEYGVTFSHPRTDSLTFLPEPRPVALERGQETSVQLAVPSPDVIYEAVCGSSPRRNTRAIVGTVSTDGEPASGTTVNVVWQQDAADILEALSNDNVSVRSFGANAVSDSLGHYKVCGVPSGVMLVVAAQTDSSWGRATTVNFDTAGVWHMPEPCLDQSPHDLLRAVANLGSNPRSRAACYGTQRFAPTTDLVWRQDLEVSDGGATTILITGTVVDASGRAVDSASVSIMPLSGSVHTGPDGTFDIVVPRRGDLLLVVEKVGHTTVRYQIPVTNRQMIRIPADRLTLIPVR